MNYKSGDLVTITGNCNHHHFPIGETVRLKYMEFGDWKAEYPDGRENWWVRESDMKPFKPAIMPQKIVITTDGKITLARLFDGKTMVKRAEAKCAPSDTFNFNTGANLAFNRLVYGTDYNPQDVVVKAKPAPTESKPEPMKLYGAKSLSCLVTKGKLYEFVNGDIALDDGLRADGAYSDYPHFVKDNPRISACLVPLIRRPAKVGEWVYVTGGAGNHAYTTNRIYKVFRVCDDFGEHPNSVFLDNDGRGRVNPSEYFVLDGYRGDSE